MSNSGKSLANRHAVLDPRRSKKNHRAGQTILVPAASEERQLTNRGLVAAMRRPGRASVSTLKRSAKNKPATLEHGAVWLTHNPSLPPNAITAALVARSPMHWRGQRMNFSLLSPADFAYVVTECSGS